MSQNRLIQSARSSHENGDRLADLKRMALCLLEEQKGYFTDLLKKFQLAGEDSLAVANHVYERLHPCLEQLQQRDEIDLEEMPAYLKVLVREFAIAYIRSEKKKEHELIDLEVLDSLPYEARDLTTSWKINPLTDDV